MECPWLNVRDEIMLKVSASHQRYEHCEHVMLITLYQMHSNFISSKITTGITNSETGKD